MKAENVQLLHIYTVTLKEIIRKHDIQSSTTWYHNPRADLFIKKDRLLSKILSGPIHFLHAFSLFMAKNGHLQKSL